MKQVRQWGENAGRYSSLLGLAIFWLLVDFGVRIWLLAYSAESLSWNLWVLINTFAAGLFFDIGVVAQGMISLGIYLTLVPEKWFSASWHRKILLALVWLASCLMIFGGIAEFFFWQEFQNRFNFIAVDYLIYTTEVLGNIRESYPIFPLLGLISILGALVTWILNRYFLSWETHIQWKKRGAIALLLMLSPGVSFLIYDGKYKISAIILIIIS